MQQREHQVHPLVLGQSHQSHNNQPDPLGSPFSAWRCLFHKEKKFLLCYQHLQTPEKTRASLVAQTVKNLSACNVETLGSIPGSERSLVEGNGNPLQYSCLGNPMDREALQATAHRVAKSQTTTEQLTLSLAFYTHTQVTHSTLAKRFSLVPFPWA